MNLVAKLGWQQFYLINLTNWFSLQSNENLPMVELCSRWIFARYQSTVCTKTLRKILMTFSDPIDVWKSLHFSLQPNGYASFTSGFAFSAITSSLLSPELAVQLFISLFRFAFIWKRMMKNILRFNMKR